MRVVQRREILALRHQPYQGLGALTPVLARRGFRIRYVDVPASGLAALDPLKPDLVVVLGGPFDVGDARLPFIAEEIGFAGRRIEAGLPVLGICLGSQILALALGADVRQAPVREIGWKPLRLTEAGRSTPLKHLSGLKLLHWHGDTFDLPSGCNNLASTDRCRHQAFAVGRHVLALQFHVEVDPAVGIEDWISGHREELERDGLEPAALLAETVRAARQKREGVSRMFDEWLEAAFR